MNTKKINMIELKRDNLAEKKKELTDFLTLMLYSQISCLYYWFLVSPLLMLDLSVMLVNDELLQRLTNGKTSLNKPLHIPRSTETSAPLDYHSPPDEVADWLRGKGFSEPWVTSHSCWPLRRVYTLGVTPVQSAQCYAIFVLKRNYTNDVIVWSQCKMTDYFLDGYNCDSKLKELSELFTSLDFHPELFVLQDGDVFGSADRCSALFSQ